MRNNKINIQVAMKRVDCYQVYIGQKYTEVASIFRRCMPTLSQSLYSAKLNRTNSK